MYKRQADPYADDRFGRLALTFAGLEARDRLVYAAARAAGAPLAVAMAGGYARNIIDTVRIHAATIRLACEVCG